VERGETIGIVGQNGSGKSTILKLITRILYPTEGQVCVGGKISALIELGAGFHPDLTGRENIYLNGSILGLGRRDMDRRIGQIVEFSELERFIDTPVRHYSSGMYARLGFSVAVSVDPDILIVDEVLAVGDEAFGRKCLDKFGEFRQQGKTILMVPTPCQSSSSSATGDLAAPRRRQGAGTGRARRPELPFEYRPPVAVSPQFRDPGTNLRFS